MRITKANKLLINFSFWLQWRWAFEVFKWTDGYIFKCEIAKKKDFQCVEWTSSQNLLHNWPYQTNNAKCANDEVVLFVRRNNLASDKRSVKILNEIINLAIDIRDNIVKLSISSIILGNDDVTHFVSVFHFYRPLKRQKA